MSELYSVFIQDVTGEYVDMDVVVIHPDAGPVSTGPCFALMLLYDPIDEYNYGDEDRVKDSPLAQEMDLDGYLNPEVIKSQALGFISTTELVREHHHPPPAWGDPSYQELWDSDERPEATLRITPTHPAWIAHLREGMSWETAAYDCGPPHPWERPPREPGDQIRQIAEDPMAGMVAGEVDDENRSMLEGAMVEAFIMPELGVSHYTTKERLEGEALTPEALQELLGQPVLSQGDWGRLEIGTLVRATDQGQVTIFKQRNGSMGSTGYDISSLEWIGRAWYVERHWADEIDVE